MITLWRYVLIYFFKLYISFSYMYKLERRVGTFKSNIATVIEKKLQLNISYEQYKILKIRQYTSELYG